MPTRQFPLADVLSATTGLLLTRGGGTALDNLLNWMTGDHLSWWQAPRAADHCTEVLIRQHPFLADLKPPAGADKADLFVWLVAAEACHGEALSVAALTDWVHQDPAQELVDRVVLASLLGEPAELASARESVSAAVDGLRALGAASAGAAGHLAVIAELGEAGDGL